jgi:hypothetical protein
MEPSVRLVLNNKPSCFYLGYLSTLKKEATFSSETSVDFQQSEWRCVTEDRIILTITVRNLISTEFINL